jgi:hypothetical protein
MGKKNKKAARGAQQRSRWNYLENKMETVPGTKAGRKRSRLPVGHPLRTHDLHGVVDKRGKKIKQKV